MNKISIDPITRLEGHGKIEIFLDDAGEVANAYFVIPELRGFEQFCLGRPAEDMPRITQRICGVCPEAHHMASTKALDALWGVEPSSAVKKLREMWYMAFYVTDHTTHFYALGGPDFIVGPDAPPLERNILGVVAKVGLEIGSQVIDARQRNHHVIEMLGGRGIHPAAGMPGGWSRAIASEEERAEIEAVARKNIDFGLFSIQAFKDIVLANQGYVDLIVSEPYTQRANYMGTVDANNHVNFYDGKVRVVGPDGKEVCKYGPSEYLDHVAEHVEPWTYLKFPYIKDIGWKGFVDGPDSGVYQATPLSRLNAADGMATPQAQAAYEEFYSTLGGKPVHHTLAAHWARLIELLYAAERMVELITDPEIMDPNVRVVVNTIPKEGVAIVEAPRGTLTHHYKTDERGILTFVNLIVGTTNNYASIAMTVRNVAKALIHKGVVIDHGLLNKIEMGFRSYDPCFACATHSLPGQMPLEVVIYNADKEVVECLSQYID